MICYGAKNTLVLNCYYIYYEIGWDGYWDDEETGIWNCDLKTYISPPAATKEKGQFVDGQGLLEEVKDQFFTYAYHDYHRFALLYLNHFLLHQTHFLLYNHFFSS